MGKTTRYHPVSLTVIRAAAMYCGFEFGDIRQLWADEDRRYARYVALLKKVPKKFEQDSVAMLQSHLADCFMDDVRPCWLRPSKKGQWMVDLAVQLPEDEQ